MAAGQSRTHTSCYTTTSGRQGLDFGAGSSRANNRVFKAHLPETFDPSVVRPAWRAYASWVVSAVVIRRYLDKDADETTFVPLDSRYIKKHVPANIYRPLLNDLLEAGVLECDWLYYFGSYLDGGPGKCYCYRLGEAHRTAKVRPCDVLHTELVRKVNNYQDEERDTLTDPTHRALRAWHDRVEVLPSAPYGEHVLLDLMIEGERRFTVCKQGRCHTNVANLPRQYRQFIRLDGRELNSCDISTSQPLILALLLTGRGKAKGQEAVASREAVLVTSSDSSLSDFFHDCLEGSVYDRVGELIGYSRDRVKSLFLAVIYGEPRHMYTQVGKAIRQLYPAVFDTVKRFNARKHGALPRLMQKMESSVMIDRVAARLLREYPSMPLLTVHDSVLVPEEYSQVASQVISEEWLGEFGVEPNLKHSVFTSPQSPRVRKKKKPKHSQKGRRLPGCQGTASMNR